MELKEQLTSLAPSKRLRELGVKQESEFYWQHTETLGIFSAKTEIERDKFRKDVIVHKENVSKMAHWLYSAFSVAENDNALPTEVDFGEDVGSLTMKKSKYGFEYSYRTECDIYASSGILKKQADAGALLRIWLIENKLIEV